MKKLITGKIFIIKFENLSPHSIFMAFNIDVKHWTCNCEYYVLNKLFI